jgi:hypothetical protein
MQGIEIPIGAPLGQLDKDLNNAQKALKGFTVDANGDLLSIGKSLSVLERQLKVFKDGIKNSTDPGRILVLNNAIKATEGQLSGAKNAINGVGFNKFSAGSNQAAFALQNLGRVAQDAPFGFIGIQNNLNPLLESFQRLKVETGSTGGALKALVGSLTGAGGLGLALSVVSAAVLFADMGLRAWGVTSIKTKEKINETTKSFKEQRDEFLKSPYETAVVGLRELTTKVSLAKQGFLDKGAVLKEYNESIGKTIGKVNDLDSAEQALVNNGGKYLQLMLLKAKAEFAFKKAAEQSYEIIKKQNEIEVNKNPLNLDKKALADLQKLGKQPITALTLQTKFDEQTELKKLNTFADRAVNIANTAQQEVIDFAKKSGFNLDGLFDINPDKLKGSVKTVSDILKTLDIDFKQISSDMSITFGKGNEERVSAIKKAINELIGIGFNADSSIIKKLQTQLLAIDPSEIDAKGKQVGVTAALGIGAGISSTMPIVAKDMGNSLKLGLTDWQTYVNESLLPKLETNFQTFFNDILMNGKLSFDSLGKAILNTMLSVIASDAARQLTNLFKFSGGSEFTQSQKSGGAGLLGGIAKLIGIGGGGAAAGVAAAGSLSGVAASTGGVILGAPIAAAGTVGLGTAGAAAGATAATGGLLLPILAGVAAFAGIASLFKKKQQAPIPQASSTISTSAAGSSQDFGGGRVVFEISGTNLIGVLNRAGAKLQRFGP